MGSLTKDLFRKMVYPVGQSEWYEVLVVSNDINRQRLEEGRHTGAWPAVPDCCSLQILH